MFKLMTTVLLIPLSLLVLHPLLVLYWCIIVPATRLSQQDYGQGDGDSSKANLKPAMIIFYSLALAQGTLYMLWFVLNAGNTMMVRVVASKCDFEKSWGRKSVDQYLSDTKFKCLKDPSFIRDRNLIKYVAGLLDSDYEDDWISGARMLVSFIQKQNLPVKLLIRSSRNRTQKLIAMLGWTDPADQEIRVLAAIIVAHVAGNISLAQFPGALQSISSLQDPILNPYFFVQKDQHDHDKGMGRCQQILQGLLVVERLTRDENNCILISRNHSLLGKIGDLIRNSSKITNQDCVLWQNMLKSSVRALAFFAANVSSEDRYIKFQVIIKLRLIDLITESGPDIQIAAIALYAKLLSVLGTDFPREPFVKIMLPLFLSCTEMKQGEEFATAEAEVKVCAGAALAMLSSKSDDSLVRDDIMNGDKVFDELTRLLTAPNTTVREITVDILKNVYGPVETSRLSLAEKVVTELFRCNSQTGTQAQTGALAITVESEQDGVMQFHGDNAQASSQGRLEHEEQSNYIELLATLLPFLSSLSMADETYSLLAKVIEKIAPRDGLSTFVGMLKSLVEKHSRLITEDDMVIISAVGTLAMTMIYEFGWEIWEQKLVEALSEASKIMSGTSLT